MEFLMKNFLILGFCFFGLLFFGLGESFGSGTYTPTQKRIQFALSQKLQDEYEEVRSLFGVSKSYRHKEDPQTVISYKVMEEEEVYSPESLAPKKYVELFRDFRKAMLVFNGAKNLKLTKFKLDRKKGEFYRYKISGEYQRHNGEMVEFHELHFIKEKRMVMFQVITMKQGNAVITQGEAFDLFQEIEEAADES